MGRHERIPEATAPRGMTREQAASYCGQSPSGFDAWVARGIVPKPIPGTRRWDRRAIDRALDKLSGLGEPEPQSAYERWRAERAARGA